MSTENTMEKTNIARADTEAVSVGVEVFEILGFADSNFDQGEVHVIPLEKADIYTDAARKDKALVLLATHHIVFNPSSAEAKRALRKIDIRIMPMVFIVYLLQLTASPLRKISALTDLTLLEEDKNSSSFGAIMGIKTDTHLTTNQYSWLGSIV
jgi:hypothetical protein